MIQKQNKAHKVETRTRISPVVDVFLDGKLIATRLIDVDLTDHVGDMSAEVQSAIIEAARRDIRTYVEIAKG